jgi:ubiquinone/menaquinone biosynthesis C-methylase UbiE/uncharacterized protein YbaR (Trm112 family)
MNQESLDIICCPHCKGELTNDAGIEGLNDPAAFLLCNRCNRKFTSTEGYLDFLGDSGLVFSSRREAIIRSLYAKAYTPANNFLFLFCGGAKNARTEVLRHLDLDDGALVLETGMGAGENLLWINNRNKNLRFYGIDIQKQMMTHCIKNTGKWGIQAELFRADALDLPFRDAKFDVVFHLGAINLFPDKRKAIEEMIRVTRPGRKIIIADETDKASKYFNYFTGSNEKVIPPLDYIPESVKDTTFKIIWRGFGYLIMFTRP